MWASCSIDVDSDVRSDLNIIELERARERARARALLLRCALGADGCVVQRIHSMHIWDAIGILFSTAPWRCEKWLPPKKTTPEKQQEQQRRETKKLFTQAFPRPLLLEQAFRKFSIRLCFVLKSRFRSSSFEMYARRLPSRHAPPNAWVLLTQHDRARIMIFSYIRGDLRICNVCVCVCANTNFLHGIVFPNKCWNGAKAKGKDEGSERKTRLKCTLCTPRANRSSYKWMKWVPSDKVKHVFLSWAWVTGTPFSLNWERELTRRTDVFTNH